MLIIASTPLHAGISVSGDRRDLQTLYDALWEVVEPEEALHQHYEGSRLRVLGFCYDLRHALMGDRDVEFVDSGMDAARAVYMGVIAPEKSLYFQCNVMWPEAIFIMMVLNDLTWMYARRKAKSNMMPLTDWRAQWDPVIAQVRLFQSETAVCLKGLLSEAAYARALKLMNRSFPWMENYRTQWVDIQNVRYLDLGPEYRLEKLSITVKRLADRNAEYIGLERKILDAAAHYKCTADGIDIGLEYPDFEW